MYLITGIKVELAVTRGSCRRVSSTSPVEAGEKLAVSASHGLNLASRLPLANLVHYVALMGVCLATLEVCGFE